MNAKKIETPKVEEPKAVKLKVKIVSISEYMTKAVEVYGKDNLWNNAVAMLYSENKVIQVLNRKGEDKFVCEV